MGDLCMQGQFGQEIPLPASQIKISIVFPNPARTKVFVSSAIFVVCAYDLALLMTRKRFAAPLPLKREGKPRTRSKEATSLGISRATLTMDSLFITRKGALLTLRAKRSR